MIPEYCPGCDAPFERCECQPILQFDIHTAMSRLREIEVEAKRLRRQIRHYRREGDYGMYLQSDHWKSLRKQFCGPGATCCGCGYDADLTLHHMTYARLYGEVKGDLICLCNRCHQKLHEWLTAKYPGKTIKAKNRRHNEYDLTRLR